MGVLSCSSTEESDQAVNIRWLYLPSQVPLDNLIFPRLLFTWLNFWIAWRHKLESISIESIRNIALVYECGFICGRLALMKSKVGRWGQSKHNNIIHLSTEMIPTLNVGSLLFRQQTISGVFIHSNFLRIVNKWQPKNEIGVVFPYVSGNERFLDWQVYQFTCLL